MNRLERERKKEKETNLIIREERKNNLVTVNCYY